jgi:transcriptional regulator with XRE-family HTH domain
MAKTVGDRIRERRLELGVSQRELACQGVSYAYISRLESNDRRASVRAIRKIALRLGVSAHWLETGEEDPAEELARLVLDHQRKPLPSRAATLARRILRAAAQS